MFLTKQRKMQKRKRHILIDLRDDWWLRAVWAANVRLIGCKEKQRREWHGQ